MGVDSTAEYYKQYDNCEALQYLEGYYSILEMGLLWCGVPYNELESEKSNCTQSGTSGINQGIFTHPYISCVRTKTQIIASAIENNQLMFARDGGKEIFKREDNVAWHRRKIKGRTFKAFLENRYPTEKPTFLFDEIERSVNDKITIEAYQSLQAKNQALQDRLNKGLLMYKTQSEELKGLQQENEKLKLQTNTEEVHPRTKATLYAVIRTLKATLLDTQCRKSFASQSQLIDHLLEKFPNQPISKASLENIFAEINKTFSE